jgi:tRNA threonylcarbamoyladenosine biosynthesis protein TsaB
VARGLTLAIETSNPSVGGAGVAIGVHADGPARVLGVEPAADPSRREDDLVPAIDRLTRRLGVTARDLGRVAVSVGPGGYTGVRTAVAVGKMIAEVAGARCVGVPSYLVPARRVGAPPGPFAVCLASKRDSTYAALFSARGDPVGTPRLVTASDLAGLGVALLVADRFLPGTIRAAAERLGVRVEEPVFDPAACFEASLGLAEVDPASLLPLYPREPEAVTQWRRRARA